MRLATTIALALCIALPGPIAANASDAVIPNSQAPNSRSVTLQIVQSGCDRLSATR